MATKAIAERVAILETRLAKVEDLLAATPAKDEWQKTIGVFQDDPIYDEVVRLGRAWRRRENKRKLK